jgi:LacI family transcriptional regulator, xylobiose transport system transcriptional regulator
MSTTGLGRRGRRRGDVTVAGIARLAGVSVPTVSKVLNGRSGVAATTRLRVEAVMREQGYRRPDSVGVTPVIEVLFHALETHQAIQIMRGVERVADGHELAVAFTEARGGATRRRSWIDQVLRRRPTGVIAVYPDPEPERQARLVASGIPLVVVDPTGEPLHATPSVGATNWSGGVAATRHLLDLGHRRIAMIGGPRSMLSAQARLDGFRAAMAGAGAPVDPKLVRAGRFSFEEGVKHGRALLRLPDPPTAVFAADDLLAFGLYEAAREAGVRIPADLSVVGFDDIEPALWCGPPLTTVRQPLVEMGAAAAELVLALAAGQDPEHTRLELATELVIRQSTAPAPGPARAERAQRSTAPPR